MKRIEFALIIIGIFWVCKAYAYDNNDFQIWHTQNQEFKIKDNSKLTLEEEFYWGDNASDFYYHHYDAGFVYSLNKYLDLGVNYRQVYEKKKGDFKEENRPHLGAVLNYPLWGFKFSDRNRFEYRHFDYQDDFWRYRNKFTAKFPWKFTKMEIQPYVADEFFVDLEDGGIFNKNRFYAGFGFGFTDNIKAELYYLLQSSKSSGDWNDANVFGSKLKLKF